MSFESGSRSWDQFSAHSSGFTWAWQDINGVAEVGTLPATPPLTSILWGWSDRQVVRVRLDGGTAYVAVRDIEGLTFTDHEAWSDTDKRVAAHVKKVNAGMTDLGLQNFSSVVVRNESGSPVTFIIPTRFLHTAGSVPAS